MQEALLKKSALPQLVCPECKNGDQSQFGEVIKFVVNKNKHYDLYVDGQLINNSDFNRLKNIILFQNFIDYHDDSWVDPDLKKDYEAKMELKAKEHGNVEASLERKIVALSINTNYKFEEIYNMTIRKFTIALNMVVDLIDYKIMKLVEKSGFVNFPKGYKSEHWLYKTKQDIYGQYKSLDEVTKEHNMFSK